jgi:hypothetical protein
MDFDNKRNEVKKKVLIEVLVGTLIFLFGVLSTYIMYRQTGIFNGFIFYGITFFSLLSFLNIPVILWKSKKYKKTA